LIYGGVAWEKPTSCMPSATLCTRPDRAPDNFCITAEEFTNEFIQMIHDRSAHEFKNKYRNADILLIDDIHFFQNKPVVRKSLPYLQRPLRLGTPDGLYPDRHVKELKDFSDRLKSRFDKDWWWTSTAHLRDQGGDSQQKLLTIREKGERGRGGIDLVASNVSSNVRDLEGCLTKLTAYAELVHKDLSVDIARNLLKEMYQRQATLRHHRRLHNTDGRRLL
jgi:chromosomal replication initiator protein